MRRNKTFQLSLIITLAIAINSGFAEVIPVHDCSEIKNPGTYQDDVFCYSAYQYYTKLKQTLQNMTGNDDNINGNFTYYAHTADVVKAGQDANQTQLACNSADLRQIDLDDKGNNIYPNNYPNDNFKSGLGEPLCQFLAYIGSVEETQTWTYHKSPIEYFNAIMNNPIDFGPTQKGHPNRFDQYVEDLSANAEQNYIDKGGQVSSMYMPNGWSIPFTENYYKDNTDKPYSAYWGMSAGGGSGAGFQVYIGTEAAEDNVVFTGGSGGGGGFTSPEFDYDKDGSIKNIKQISIGSGGGGGVQFANSGKYTQFTEGLGLGAGVGTGPKIPDTMQVEYSYNKNNSVTSHSYNADTVSEFMNEMKSLKGLMKNKTVVVKGGGGMGVGAEYLYLDQNNNSIQEYTPHIISTGGGFTFAFTIQPKSMPNLLLQPNKLINSNDVQFYQNLGAYYNLAMTLALAHTEGYGGYSCALYMCEYAQDYVLKQAINDFSGKDNVPSWLKVDQCKYGGYNPDPPDCPVFKT
ncbi:hypothetical protein OAO18_09195 [Francisellaceae bacterium]|nr:hypothetical protein [Francisellaceae bacterium]